MIKMYAQKPHFNVYRPERKFFQLILFKMVWRVFSCLLVALGCYYLTHPALAFADSPSVTQEIRYHMPEAGEVFLVWGVNSWAVVPEATRPAGTVVKDSVMYTPMVREGNTFVARVKVPTRVTIDYVFQITKKRDGTTIEVWDANGNPKQDFHTTAVQNGVVLVKPTVNLTSDSPSAETVVDPLVTQEIRYRMPEAGEVFLVWGINGWASVPEKIRPAGTVMSGTLMYTPMVGENDTFIANVQVPTGATIDYVFQITKHRSGQSIEVWDANGNPKQDYHTIAMIDDVVTINSKLTLELAQMPSSILMVKLLWPGLWLLLGIGLGFGLVIVHKYIPQYAVYLRNTLSRLLSAGMLGWFVDAKLSLLLICCVFVIHSGYFGSYIADDAAISLTYARNLVQGYGLVLNPGGERVEAYSNFLLVLVEALAFKVGLGFLGPIWLLKLLGLAFGLGTLAVLFFLTPTAYESKNNYFLQLFGSVVLATSSSFVYWSVAGLENPLYSFLILLSLYFYLKEIRNPSIWPLSSILLVLVALTRPEGVMYFVIFTIHRTLILIHQKRLPSRCDFIWGSTFIVLFGSFLFWRYNYFGYWVPNTFYAKVPDREITQLWRYLLNFDDPGWRYILDYMDEQHLLYFLVFIVFAILDRKHWSCNLLFLGLLASNLLYIVYVGGDWWQQFRFFSPVIPLMAILVGRGLDRTRELLKKQEVFWSLVLVTVVVIIVTNTKATMNILGFNDNLMIGMQSRMQRGMMFKEIAQKLYLQDPKYLEPDIGGVSFISGLHIIDLAKLADVHLARFQYYPPFFKQYIFKEQRPEFIHTHSVWTRASKITTYPEFWETYLPITSYQDEYGISGDFVRKDLFVINDISQVSNQLNVEFGQLNLLGFLPDTPVTFPGQAFLFTWYWRCQQKCEQNYSLILEIRKLDQSAVVSKQYSPVFGWYPTSQWAKSEIIKETREVVLPSGLVEGSYQIFIGVTDGKTRQYQKVGDIVISSQLAHRLAHKNFLTYTELKTQLRWEDAFQSIMIAVKLDPSNNRYAQAVEEAQDGVQRSLIDQSVRALKAKAYDTAASVLLRAMAIKPLPYEGQVVQQRLSEVFFEQGQSEFLQHEYVKAFEHFREALQIDPSNVWARHRLEDTRLKVHKSKG